MTSVKVKFSPSSVILKEGTVHYQIIHHCKVRHIRTGYNLYCIRNRYHRNGISGK